MPDILDAILTLGDPLLEQVCAPVQEDDPDLPGEIERLHLALATFQQRKGFGRAIAAPQIGVMKRFICLNLGATPFAVINPEITWRSEDLVEVWDDCLSIPDRVVRVQRHRSISFRFVDDKGRPREWPTLPQDMSELLQHEIDHLDGVLMTHRAMDDASVRPIAEHGELVGPSRPTHRLSLASIKEAAQTIEPVFLHSPQFEDELLSDHAGCHLTLKLETANPIRSFKGRGASYFLRKVVERGDERPLVCASAGNFGQAMAYAARRYGRDLTVFAATSANRQKVERMRRLGATVQLEGDDFDAAKEAARCHCKTYGSWMVEDGREPEISEGAGSIAVELLADGAAYDDIVVPLGNGALLGGIARWFKASSPSTRVVGVCSAGADAMEQSWRQAQVVVRDRVDTVADGIAVRVPVPEAVADLQELIDDVLLVDDDLILRAMRDVFEIGGWVTEPAGAVGVAAILGHSQRFAGRRVATVLCGGNVALEDGRAWLLGGD